MIHFLFHRKSWTDWTRFIGNIDDFTAGNYEPYRHRMMMETRVCKKCGRKEMRRASGF